MCCPGRRANAELLEAAGEGRGGAGAGFSDLECVLVLPPSGRPHSLSRGHSHCLPEKVSVVP